MINYVLLTKPGIIAGNLITVAAGFLLASKGHIDIPLFFETLIGLALVIASACVFNNYIDQDSDKKMARTKNRPLVTGLISGSRALVLATVLGMLGFVILGIYTNLLTVAIAAIGFLVYVLLYSLWKRHTIYGTAIGSIAGAVPPLVGYCAVSNTLDMGAFILFLILVVWQMPHFYAIALMHLQDYTKANIPVLPVERGILRTKYHMVAYIVAFIASASLLTFFGYTGNVYLAITTATGVVWLVVGILGFSRTDERQWGREMFRISLVVIIALCLAIPFDVIP